MIKKLIIVLFLFFSFVNTSFANTPCHINDDCGEGRVCMGNQMFQNGFSWTLMNSDGTYKAIDTTNPYTNADGSGICSSNAIADGICNVYKIATGKFARLVVAFAVIMLAQKFWHKEFDWKQLMVIVIGVGMIFGSFQIISFIINKKSLSETCSQK